MTFAGRSANATGSIEANEQAVDRLSHSALSQAEASAKNLSITSDADILAFALNLEYLAANYWSCVATGLPLTANLTGGGPAPIGCAQANLSSNVQYIAVEVAQDERAHVNLLRQTLRSRAPAQPLINLTAAVTFINEATSGNVTLEPVGADDLTAALAGFIVSDMEPTAYRGALSLVHSNLLRSVVAGQLATEAYHAGILHALLASRLLETVGNSTVQSIVQAISDRRDALDGGGDDEDQGLVLNNVPNLVPTDSNALVFARTPSQVLSILYDGGTNNGGFFPDGINIKAA